MQITGLGPHGERAVPADRIVLSPADGAAARARRFSVAVVLHTTTSDWSKQELAGIVTTLGRYSAAVVDVVDCGFDAEAQNKALRRLAKERIDAVISIPIGSAVVAEAHRSVAEAGIKLMLMDNAPIGLMPGKDYASVVSADNFGLGEIAAELLAPCLPKDATAGILAYGVDFFVTHEREIAFRKWMGSHRPDVALVRGKFSDVANSRAATNDLLDAQPALAGLFAVWDVPAKEAVIAVRSRGLTLPITTIDLGNEVVAELASGGLIKGIGAQQPYDQGVALGVATLLALLGKNLPPWIALPGLAVTRQNVVEAYQVVWHTPAPPAIVRGRLAARMEGN